MPKEYIERSKAIEVIKDYGKGAIEDGQKTLDPVDDIILLQGAVKMIRSADVVDVVRCGQCGNYCKNTGECNLYGRHPNENDFCSSGIKEREGK